MENNASAQLPAQMNEAQQEVRVERQDRPEYSAFLSVEENEQIFNQGEVRRGSNQVPVAQSSDVVIAE